MQNTQYLKLERLTKVWRNIISQHDFFSREIFRNQNVELKFVGNILGYLEDTSEVIYNFKETNNRVEKFYSQIGLLQSIYTQQDLIVELLKIFGFNKNELRLWQDENYKINRDIRNELIGHPMSYKKKSRGEENEFVSSCLFGYDGDKSNITYLKYSKENNFECRVEEHTVSDILLRHERFMSHYLEKILEKIKQEVVVFIKKLECFNIEIKYTNVEKSLNDIDLYFEIMYSSWKISDKNTLLSILARIEDHDRYKNFINCFLDTLKSTVIDVRAEANEFLDLQNELPSFSDPKKDIKPNNNVSRAIGKLIDKNNFVLYSNILKRQCSDNVVVYQELKHMEDNLEDDIEYYTALRLIHKELDF
ncbi:hypothetical protein HMPREF9713_00270 [Myroides odoratimimus CCUG 12700]|uniref:hypothetical protein n=1 Tax=Myroides odoratimimus TaxID=76832 RepID=UPI00035292E7|nr:hypothetical protein [Myroides odoratimimus]EPH14070.1 hypothetical protein HMPREF9713_00270 [Myroides odoratimimus CCUG 12700]